MYLVFSILTLLEYFALAEYPVYENIKPKFLKYILKNTNNEVQCPLEHRPTDLVRWYKDKALIHKGTTLVVKMCAKYSCRVSNFSMSTSKKMYCKSGANPRFSNITGVDIRSRVFNDENRMLNCAGAGGPKPNITWIFNGVKLETRKDQYSYTYEETISSIGQYECILENEFGKINRTFNVTGSDCALSIKKDFDRHHPLIVISSDSANKIEILKEYMIIRKNVDVTFFCPGGFNMFADTEIEGTCIENQIFRTNETSMEYPKLTCVEEFTPTIIKTGIECRTSDTELYRIGININEKFEETYRICFDKRLNIPLYEEHNITNFCAGVQSKNEEIWFNNDLFNYNITEMFDCNQQMTNTASTFEITTDDNCCFALRKLVNEKDLHPGFAQITTYSYLNVIPHWSTCSMTNWNALEDLLRRHAKWCEGKCLEIATGISQSLQIPVGESNVTLHVMDKSSGKILVPVFLWKVIKDLNKRTSVAIIQSNIPISLKRYIPISYPCENKCDKIEWMKSIDTADENKGLMYCCSTREFEKNFKYKNKFTKSIYLNLLTKLFM